MTRQELKLEYFGHLEAIGLVDILTFTTEADLPKALDKYLDWFNEQDLKPLKSATFHVLKANGQYVKQVAEFYNWNSIRIVKETVTLVNGGCGFGFETYSFNGDAYTKHIN